jgi:GTP cyclohydrolase II
VSEISTVAHRITRHDGENVQVVVLNSEDPGPNPPCAAVFGEPSDGCLVRIQSRCTYGEIFGSINCDCREQLDSALAQIRAEGTGVLIYLDQEGRGQGLVTKAQAYHLTQTQGLDTYAGYAHLGAPADSRTYESAATLLTALNLGKVRLLTNNPDKITGLQNHAIDVDRVPLPATHLSEEGHAYLAAKQRQGHQLTLPETPAPEDPQLAEEVNTALSVVPTTVAPTPVS